MCVCVCLSFNYLSAYIFICTCLCVCACVCVCVCVFSCVHAFKILKTHHNSEEPLVFETDCDFSLLSRLSPRLTVTSLCSTDSAPGWPEEPAAATAFSCKPLCTVSGQLLWSHWWCLHGVYVLLPPLPDLWIMAWSWLSGDPQQQSCPIKSSCQNWSEQREIPVFD